MGKNINLYINFLKMTNNVVNVNEIKEMIKPNKAKNGKALCLVRVSTVGQDLQQQTDYVKKEVYKDGYTDDNIILIENKESAVLLSETERQGLNKLKQYVLNDNIEAVYTYELSRISRQPKILYSIRDFLIEHNVQLVVLRPFMKLLNDDGTMSETASLMFSIFGSLAEQEGFIRKERMMRGKHKARSEGRFTGGAVVFGYKLDKTKHIVVDEDAAKLVCKIFDMYANKDMSTLNIATELLSTGELWQDSHRSARTFVNLLLRNNAYYGGNSFQNYTNKVEQKKVKYGNIYPAIMSKELWDKAMEKRNKQMTNVIGRNTKYTYYGKDLVKYNGHRMTPLGNMCKYEYNDYVTGDRFSVNINMVESLLWYHTLYILNNRTEDVRSIIKELRDKQNKLFKKSAVASSKIKSLEEQIKKIEMRIIKNKISEEVGDELQEKIYAEMLELSVNAQKYEEEAFSLQYQMEDIASNKRKHNYSDITDDDERKQLVHKHIHECNILPGDKLFTFNVIIDGISYYVNSHQSKRKIYCDKKEIVFEYLERFKRHK